MRGWIWKPLGAVLVAAAIAVTATGGIINPNTPAATPTPTATATPGAGTANIWVDTNGGTCADNASLVAYSDAAACASFQAAYTAAEAGDTVGVKNGTYNNQSISTATRASDVTFVGESQDGVVLTGEVILAGTHMHLRNMTFNSFAQNGWQVRIAGNNITWTDFIARGPKIGIQVSTADATDAPDNFTWDGGSLGHPSDTPGLRCGGPPFFDIEPFEIYESTGHVIRNLDVWPQAGAPAPCLNDGFHEEDFRIHSGNTLIENIDFKDGNAVNNNMGSGKIFLSGSGVQNVVVRNVIFGRGDPSGLFAMQDNATGCTVTVAYSTMTTKPLGLDQCSVTEIHNIGPNATGVSPTTGRLSGTATSAINQGAADCSSVLGLNPVDVDGDLRPVGPACDKGADEYNP